MADAFLSSLGVAWVPVDWTQSGRRVRNSSQESEDWRIYKKLMEFGTFCCQRRECAETQWDSTNLMVKWNWAIEGRQYTDCGTGPGLLGYWNHPWFLQPVRVFWPRGGLFRPFVDQSWFQQGKCLMACAVILFRIQMFIVWRTKNNDPFHILLHWESTCCISLKSLLQEGPKFIMEFNHLWGNWVVRLKNNNTILAPKLQPREQSHFHFFIQTYAFLYFKELKVPFNSQLI